MVNESSSYGYISEFDLEYPHKLHGLHNDYSLVPEQLEIGRGMLSKYFSDIADQYSIKISGVNKLVPNLSNKNKHVLHYRSLQLYLSVGVKLIGVPRIFKFKQSDWLKQYIDFNTSIRKNAANSFEKNFSKLMNNNVHAKTMQNLIEKVKFRLVNNAKDDKKLVSRPTFFSQRYLLKILLLFMKLNQF